VVAALPADPIVVADEAELRWAKNAIGRPRPCAAGLLAAKTELAD
jgi:hypothetical protein